MGSIYSRGWGGGGVRRVDIVSKALRYLMFSCIVDGTVKDLWCSTTVECYQYTIQIRVNVTYTYTSTYILGET
jgi:hypothetical protein